MNNYSGTETYPSQGVWDSIVSFMPEIFGALVIFLIGLIIAPLIGGLFKKALDFLKIDDWSKKMGLKEILSDIGLDFSFSKLFGTLVKWFLFVVFLQASVEQLGFSDITGLLGEFVKYIPNILIAIILLAVGLAFGDFFKKTIIKVGKANSISSKNSIILGNVAKIAMITFTGMASLTQLGIATYLINILFTGIVFSLALAFALGSKDYIAKFLEEFSKKK